MPALVSALWCEACRYLHDILGFHAASAQCHAHVSTNVLSFAIWKILRLVQKRDNYSSSILFLLWLQSGEQVQLHWLVIFKLIDDYSFLLKPMCIHPMIYQWYGYLYLLQEAVLLENPLVSHFSNIGTLHRTTDKHFALCISFRPRQDSRHAETGIRETEIHPCPFYLTCWVTRYVLTAGHWNYQGWITLTKENNIWKVSVVILWWRWYCGEGWGPIQTSGLWGWIFFFTFLLGLSYICEVLVSELEDKKKKKRSGNK